MNKLISLFAFAFILSACITTEKVNTLNRVNLPDTFNKNADFEHHFKLKNIVALETKDDCLIGNINRIIIDNSKIIILNDNVEVLIYDSKTGKFVSKVRRIGNGKGEYRKIMDIAYDDDKNQLIVYTDSYKLLIFDTSCNYINDVKLNNELYEKIIYTDGAVYFYNSLTEFNKKIIQVFDLNKKIFTTEIGNENINFNIRVNGVSIVKSKSIWYANPLQNFISKINNSTVIYPYELISDRFGNEEELLKLQNSPKDFFGKIESNKAVYAFTSIRETSKNIYLKSNQHNLIWINKINNKVNCLDKIQDNRYGFTQLRYFPHDCNSDDILFILKPEKISNKKTLSDKIVNNTIIKQQPLRQEANPILVFYSEIKV